MMLKQGKLDSRSTRESSDERIRKHDSRSTRELNCFLGQCTVAYTVRSRLEVVFIWVHLPIMASLKLLVHKEQNKVLCAESDKDFVDYLFSFLTMPLGAIVQRIGSKIGSLNTLHKSVGDLETQLLQTDACKEMLHSPKSASEEQSKNLKVNIDPYYPSHADYYVCPCIGSPEKFKLASTGYRVRCRYGDELNRSVKYKKSSDGKDGVFVKEDMKFMITDDLQVSPVSTLTSFELLKKLGISDASVLEVRTEHLGDYYHGSPRDMRARLLLKHLLFSKTPLTDISGRERHRTRVTP